MQPTILGVEVSLVDSVFSLVAYSFAVPGSCLRLQHLPWNRELVVEQGIRALQPAHTAPGLCLLPQYSSRLHHGAHHLPERGRSSHGAR